MNADAKTLKILAIPGSLRRESFNRRLLHAIRAMAPRDVDIRIEQGIGALPLFDEDIEHDVLRDSSVSTLRARVAEADALLIATPEYNQSIPGVLKNAVDWLSRPAPDRDVLAGKHVAVIGATAGRWGTRLAQAALRQTLFAADCIVLAPPPLYLAQAESAFDSSGTLSDEGVRASLAGIVNFLATAVPRTP
jgi:chromate reductase